MEKQAILLIADNNNSNIKFLSSLLESDYHMIVAQDGAQTLKKIQQGRKLDLIIMDVMMPKINSLEVCQILKENSATEDIPVILLTAIENSQNEIIGMNIGAVDFVTKPFSIEDVKAKIKTQFQLKKNSDILKLKNQQLEEMISKNVELIEALERSNQELIEFTSVVSHDLKEPLRGISNYSSFLLEDFGDTVSPDTSDKLFSLKRLSERMQSMISSLLEYSRVGRVEFSFEEVNLNNVIAEVLDNLSFAIKEKNIVIRQMQTFPVIYCDSFRISEVFTNLLSNSIKYNNKEIKWIELGFYEYPVKGKTEGDLTFYVRDNGLGIKENQLENVFKTFRRLNNTEKFSESSGMGLSIAKKIIEKHRGKIWVESKYGEETVFYFSLHSGN